MRQRVMIAMALACNPDLLIADEPTTALDVTTQAQIQELLNDLKQKLNMSILLITHDIGVVAETADNVNVMYLYKNVEYAVSYTYYENPKHHYSHGLLKAIHDMEKDELRLHPIVGLVSNPTNVKQGRRFASRCPFATDLCREEAPPFFTEGKQQVKCWMYSDRWEKEAKVGGNEE